MGIKNIKSLSLILGILLCFVMSVDAQEIRTNDRGERIVIFPDGSWRYYVVGDSIYLTQTVETKIIEESTTQEKPLQTYGNDDEIAEAILIAEKATASEKSAKFILQNAVRRKEAIDQSIAYAKANSGEVSNTRISELSNQHKQVKEEIRVAKKELKIATIKRRIADKLLTVRSSTERDRLINEIDTNDGLTVNSKTRNPKVKKERVAKVKPPKVKKVKTPKAETPVTTQPTSTDIDATKVAKVKTPKIKKTKTPKVAKVKPPSVKKVKEPKVEAPVIDRTNSTKVDNTKVAKVKTTRVKKATTPKAKKTKDPKVAKVKAPRVKKVKEPKVEAPVADQINSTKVDNTKVAKVKTPRVKKVKTPKVAKEKKVKIAKVKTDNTGDVKLKKEKVAKVKTPRVKKPRVKAPKTASVKVTKTKLPKGQNVEPYAASMQWDKRDVINNPPPNNCNIRSTSVDEFSKKKMVVMEPAEFFSFTPEEIKSYLEDRDFISCNANLSTRPGLSFLTLKFTIASDNARKNFGVLEQGSLLRIMLLDGSTVNLYNGRFDAGKLDPYTGNTIYESNYIIDKEKEKLLSKKEIDKIRVVWSTGFEDYIIYNVDFFINQYDCLNKSS
jgi:hypothetical protein